MEKKNRDRLDIMADILDYCYCEPRKMREIKDNCRLHWNQSTTILTYLIDSGFLRKIMLKDCDVYLTTLKGEKLLHQYRKLKHLLTVKSVAVATH